MTRYLIPALALIAAAGAFAAFGPPDESAPAMPSVPAGRVAVEPAAVDFGDIIRADGAVSSTVTVTNTGSAPLTINRLSTSCGCTTAAMDLSDLAPQESRAMTITFDPSVHPDQTGEIIRVVYLQTSDPDVPETAIDVSGYIIE